MSRGRQAGNEWLRKSLKAARLMTTPRFRKALRQGVAAGIEHRSIPVPRDIRTVIDVGSHSGQFAIFALERFPSANLICLEPLDEPRARLVNIVQASDRDRVTVLPVAASDGAGSAEIHVSRADDSSSLLPIGQGQVEAFPGTEEVRRARVRTERLDAVVPSVDRPSLLKVDVQGHELAVLKGATGLLDAIDFVIVECSFVELYVGQALAGEVVAFLRDRGFDLAGVYGATLDNAGMSLQADIYFTASETGP